MPGSRLPVLPHPGDDEPLGTWVARLAASNRMSVNRILGGSAWSILQRLDRCAYPDELNRLQQVSGLPVEQLHAMTLAGRFPGTAPHRGWVPIDAARRADDAACPRCGPDTGLTSRLRLIPLCGRCGRLLDDGTGYTETDADPHLTRLRQAVIQHAQDAASYTNLKERVRWLRPALRHNWPTRPAHEPPARMEHALRLLAADPTTTSPAVIAALVTRALDPTVENDPGLLVRHDTGWWPTAAETDPAPLGDVTAEIARLHRTIRASGIEVRHVPLAITLGAPTPIVHPKYLGRREAWAASVRQHVATVTGTRSTLHHAILHSRPPWPDDDPWTIRLLTDTVTALHRDGLLDRERALATFSHHSHLPARVLRRLPRAARESTYASRVAAVWVALTMSGAGRLMSRGSLYAAGTLIPLFHHALTAEGRLILTEWGLQELDGWPDTAASVAALADAGHHATAGERRRVG